jgi:hypothetical protein
MKPNICSIGLSILIIAALGTATGRGTPGVNGAAGLDKPSAHPGKLNVEINADETSVVNGVAIATGHARLTYGTIIITGARLEYSPNLKQVRCPGVCRVDSGGVKTTISDQTYDLKTNKVVVPKEEVPAPAK